MAEITTVRTQSMEFAESDDVRAAAATMLEEALHFAAEKAGLSDPEAAACQLAEGHAAVTGYFHYSLAKKAAEYLGTWDRDVKAAYVFDYDATPEDICFGEARRPLVHLIVWAESKTAALAALAATLDRALAEQMASILNMKTLEYVLDVQVVDNTEVENRTGYAALLTSPQQQALRVWGR